MANANPVMVQSSLYSEDVAVISYYCATMGSQLIWLINDNALAFVSASDIYGNKIVNGFVATLLNKKYAQGVPIEFTSVLTITDFDNEVVQCYNGSLDTVQQSVGEYQVRGKGSSINNV